MHIPKHESIPTPAGHYSPVIGHNGTLYISGQLPMDPVSKAVPDSIEEQTIAALNNLENLLHAGGSRRDHVLQVRIFISDLDQWAQINKTYSEWFGEHKPARAIIPCGPLHYGCMLELEATAAIIGS
ncbi:MAG: 2-iminobutanoate/2-iminopropanoate deaminase [Planctomycetota bacterium]|jgi:2-iminobutanoate/2-iminopropanoate deaminase